MALLLITFAAFCFITLVMAVGVMFKGRCLRGSCGGEAIVDADGELLNCATCPVRKEREEQVRAAMQLGTAVEAREQSASLSGKGRGRVEPADIS